MSRKRKAFTLIELLVAAAILTMMASIVLINLDKGKTKSRDAQRKTDLTKIAQALDTYKIDNKAYPILSSFQNADSTTLNSLANYLISVPHDPTEKTSGSPLRVYQYKGTVSDYKLRATSSESISDNDLKKTDGNICSGSDCCQLDVIKQKAGDYCDPMNTKGFQISSSNTSLNW